MNKKTQEDYLRTIFHLQSDHNRAVRNIEVARFLRIKKPSVTEALNSLLKDGLIEKTGKVGITLTQKGILESRKITRKHRVIEDFLTKFLKMKGNGIHKEAHEIEHSISDEASERLYSLLGKPKTCPHGSNIPQNGKVMKLCALESGRKGKVIFTNIDDSKILDRVSSLGIIPNTDIKVISKIKKGPLTIRVKDSDIAIGDDLCQQIYVTDKG